MHRVYEKMCVRTSYVKLGVVVDGGLACQLSQALVGAVIHHEAQWVVLNQQLNCVEKPIIHRLDAVTNAQTEKKGHNFSTCMIMIDYCCFLDQTGELRRGKVLEQIGNARHKTDSKQFFLCCVCKSTNLNEKEMREICVEMLSWDVKHTDYILNTVLLWKGL